MHTVSVPLPYDLDVGDFEREAIEVLAELTRLVPLASALASAPKLTMRGRIAFQWGNVAVMTVLDGPVVYDAGQFLDWTVEAVDEVIPEDVYDLELTLTLTLDSAQALLLKGAWPHTLPRLTAKRV